MQSHPPPVRRSDRLRTARQVQPPGPVALFCQVLNLKVIFGAVMVASCLLIVTLLSLWLTRSGDGTSAPATAVLQIIPADTKTPTAAPLTGGQLPVDGAPTPLPGVLAVGAYVQVAGTGGDGLRLRRQAGLNGDVALIAAEAEVFKVVEGPVEIDNYVWWRLVGPYDETRQGWAVVNYLQVVDGAP